MMCLDSECLFFVLSISNLCRIVLVVLFFFILSILVLLLRTHFSFFRRPSLDGEMRKIYPLLLFLAPPLRKCWRELAILQSALYDVTKRTGLPLGSPFKRWGCILMFSKDLKGFRGSLFISLEKTTSQSQLKLGIPYRLLTQSLSLKQPRRQC